MTLVEFLLARITEDEAAARAAAEVNGADVMLAALPMALFDGLRIAFPARVLAECEAKRRIVEDYEALNADYRVTHAPVTEAQRFQALVSIGHLATAYSDHPDYDQTWRP